MAPTSTHDGPRASPTARRATLLACFLAALVLRLWYGWAWPDATRFWDEGYALDNVRSILVDETLLPARSYYPSPVFNLPPALGIMAAEGWTSSPEALLYDPETGAFGPWSYRICRGIQAVAGALTVLLLYLLGNRLFGPGVGLLAAALLAFVPWHIHVSGVFKPDALITFGVTAALAAAAAFYARPTWPRAALLGAAVAVAASAKLTGAMVAVPVAVGGLWLWRREPRRVGRLVFAGACSFAFFVLANPYWKAYLHFIGGLSEDYAMRAGWQDMSRWGVPVRFLDLLVGPSGFGWWVGSFALGAFGWLAVRALRREGEGDGARRAGLLAVIVLPPLYVTAYSLQTAYFKPNNFLPLFPAFALAAAAAAVTVARRFRRGRVPQVVASLAVLGPVLWLGWAFTYRSLTPSTCDFAVRTVGPRGAGGGRLVAAQGLSCGHPAWEQALRRGVHTAVMRLPDPNEERERWELADGEIFRPARVSEEVLREHRERWPEAVVTLRGRPFALRGPTLTTVYHPWRRSSGEGVELSPCGDGLLCGRAVPEAGRRVRSSVSVYYPSLRAGMVPEVGLRIDGRDVELYRDHQARGGNLWSTERFRAEPERAIEIELAIGGLSPDRVRVSANHWRPPKTSVEPDVVRDGEAVEPGEVDQRQEDEAEDEGGEGETEAALAE